MKRMISAECVSLAMALILVAGFAGQASAGLREYCDSYARDVANRKTNGGAGGLIDLGQGAGKGIGGVGDTVLGAGVASDRYKRAYANAFGRCVDNYEGTRVRNETDENGVTQQKVSEQKVSEQKVTEKKAAANEATDKNVAASEGADINVAANEVPGKKAAASEP